MFRPSGETVMACPSIPVEGEEVIPESVDLHSTLPTQTAMKLSKFQYFNPQSSLEKKGLIPFRIVSGDNEFIDPYHKYKCIVARILDGVGKQNCRTRWGRSTQC